MEHFELYHIHLEAQIVINLKELRSVTEQTTMFLITFFRFYISLTPATWLSVCTLIGRDAL